MSDTVLMQAHMVLLLVSAVHKLDDSSQNRDQCTINFVAVVDLPLAAA